MKFVFAFLLAIAVSANAQTTVVPYIVPIYRVTANPATSSTDGSTATSTTSEATTATTTDTTVSTTTTTQKSTLPALLDNMVNFIDARQIRHPRSLVLASPKGLADHTFEHICSGTLIDAKAVITTVTCMELAAMGTEVHPYVGTAADTTSVDVDGKVLYEVDKVNRHPSYDATTFDNNIAIITLVDAVDFEMSAKVEKVSWAGEAPAAETKCVASYWGSSDPFEQVVQDVLVKACDPLVAGTICSTIANPPAECPSGSNGASLVCSSKLAGIFTAQRNSDCSATLWQYQDITDDSEWLGTFISGAPILNLSFGAILVLITAMLKNL